MTTVGLAENVKSSADYQMQFVGKYEDSKPEEVCLTHIAIKFQKHVQIEDMKLKQQQIQPQQLQ